MKIFILLLFTCFAFGQTKEYTFDYYTIYDVKWPDSTSFKKLYLTHTQNPNYMMYVKLNNDFTIKRMEIYDRDINQFYRFKYPENVILKNVAAINEFIESYQINPVDWKVIKNKKNRYFKTKKVSLDDYTHIELVFYKNKKKTKIDHTIYLETQRHPTIKNQFYASGLNFFYYNLALNSIETDQFITKVYRTDNEQMSAEENLIQIKPIQLKISLDQ